MHLVNSFSKHLLQRIFFHSPRCLLTITVLSSQEPPICGHDLEEAHQHIYVSSKGGLVFPFLHDRLSILSNDLTRQSKTLQEPQRNHERLGHSLQITAFESRS